MSNINVSLENPYGEVTIPRAKIRSSEDINMVIANPMALNGEGETKNGVSSSAPPPPYVVKEAEGEEEEGRSRACCYRCRRKK